MQLTTILSPTLRKRLVAIPLTISCLFAAVACGSGSSGQSETGAKGASFGSIKNVCGPAKSTNKADSDRGVTADSIKVTTVSDSGSSLSPGLNEELWDASTVFVNWCNENGGINGRKIDMVKGDAQLIQYGSVINAACQTSFALVGGGGVFDDQGQESRVRCLLPDFSAFVTTATTRGSALVHQVIPLSNNQLSAGMLRWISEKFPETKSKIGYVSGDFAAVKLVRAQTQAAGKALGWSDPVFSKEYSVAGERNWSAIAKELTDAGVEGLVFSGQPADLSKMIGALDARGNSTVKWITADANMYDKSLIDDTGNALDRYPLYLPLYVIPFERADAKTEDSVALQRYMALFDKYLPRGKSRAMLGVQSFASWLLFAQAASACGANLTRGCIDRQASSITSFDAGGLIAPVNLSTPNPPDCFLGVKATSSGFKQVDVDPNKGQFNCDPKNVVTLSPKDFDYTQFGKPVSLDAVGRSTADLK